MVEKYCIVYMYPVVCINSTVLLQLASQSWLLYITGSKLQGYPFFINILAVFSTPPQSKHETQACSGSRDRIAAQISEVSGNKLGTDFFFSFCFFNLMLKLCQSIFDLQFCACHYCTATWFSYDIYIQCICSFSDCFAIEIIAEAQAKFHLLNIRSLLSIYDSYRFLCIYGRKERDNAFGLSITPTDFCVYVSPYLWIHPWPFFFFLYWNPLCLNSQSLFLGCNFSSFVSLFKFFLGGTSKAVVFLSLADFN